MSSGDRSAIAEIASANVANTIGHDIRPTPRSGSANNTSKILSSEEKLQANRGEQGDKNTGKGANPPLNDTPLVLDLNLTEGVDALPRDSTAENTTLASFSASPLTFTNPFTFNDGSTTIAASPLPQLPHMTPMPQLDGGGGGKPQYIWHPPETWIVHAEYWDGDYSSEDERKEPRGG